jgi:hypothetical protein
MASLFEILDPSAFAYEPAFGLARQDGGLGPPSGIGGWIRTGYDANGDSMTQGRPNCAGWSGAGSGQIALLSSDWSSATTTTSPWDVAIGLCVASRAVWCVED